MFRKFRPNLGRQNLPTEQAVVAKFRSRFTLLDISPPIHMLSVRAEEKIAGVSASVNEERYMSIRDHC